MKVLSLLRARFRPALGALCAQPEPLLELIRTTQDAKFGDYQANFAMPLQKQLGQPQLSARDIATQIVERVDLTDICEPPEVAGPGFINLRLKDTWLVGELTRVLHDDRVGVSTADPPRTFVIDYSSPNVAKPMHVGHIRSTVIGDALARTLRFLGHRVIGDNHLGDWGTQFGMIIYGYKHLVDAGRFSTQPVAELSRLYKLVNQLAEYHELRPKQGDLQQRVDERTSELAALKARPAAQDKAEQQQRAKELRRLETQLEAARKEWGGLCEKLSAVDNSPELAALARAHPEIGAAVLQETARLHANDQENLRLWKQFMPQCLAEIRRIYDRLEIRFDVELGESFYHEQLAGVVDELVARGLARESEGAICVFLDGFDTPMIIRKKDGAFLYSTTDLATIHYRLQTWQPQTILYVVDHRQSEHFEKLFAAARQLGYAAELRHISFGTVLGQDGKPYRTRAGDTVGLEGLLDEAVAKAHSVVCANDDQKPGGPELSAEERQRVATVVGHGAIKYSDLSHNRTSDYVFSYDKMLSLEGNTATYMQYCYARVQSIFARGNIDLASLRTSTAPLLLSHPAERAIAFQILQFDEALEQSVSDYRPNQLTDYLFELARRFSTFFEKCPVLKAENEALRNSRLRLCDVTGRVIRQGLALLGIDVVDRM